MLYSSLEGNYSIRLNTPLCEFFHIAEVNSVYQFQILESPGKRAVAASLDLSAFPDDAFEHSLDIVIAIRCLLVGNRASHSVREQENPYLRLLVFFLQGHRQAQRVIGFFCSIRRIVDDNQNIHTLE